MYIVLGCGKKIVILQHHVLVAYSKLSDRQHEALANMLTHQLHLDTYSDYLHSFSMSFSIATVIISNNFLPCHLLPVVVWCSLPFSFACIIVYTEHWSGSKKSHINTFTAHIASLFQVLAKSLLEALWNAVLILVWKLKFLCQNEGKQICLSKIFLAWQFFFLSQSFPFLYETHYLKQTLYQSGFELGTILWLHYYVFAYNLSTL